MLATGTRQRGRTGGAEHPVSDPGPRRSVDADPSAAGPGRASRNGPVPGRRRTLLEFRGRRRGLCRLGPRRGRPAAPVHAQDARALDRDGPGNAAAAAGAAGDGFRTEAQGAVCQGGGQGFGRRDAANARRRQQGNGIDRRRPERRFRTELASARRCAGQGGGPGGLWQYRGPARRPRRRDRGHLLGPQLWRGLRSLPHSSAAGYRIGARQRQRLYLDRG